MLSISSRSSRFSRQIVCSASRSLACTSSEISTEFEPLRILFCGSDEFSIASLNALYGEHLRDRNCITSLDVVCRPPKPTGRGLKKLREVPIAEAALKLGLPLHQIDTFRGWQPPQPNGVPINLVIAVSFGLLVPPRILGTTKYGGLNVHPSLLPDLRGPAPLHHTLLQHRARTGVTVQTLHPKHFDQGTIITQTPYPGFEHHCSNVPDLLRITAQEGAALLLRSIRNGDFTLPGSGNTPVPKQALRDAPKIVPEDRHIDWATWTADEIVLRHRVIGPLWNLLHTRGAVSTTKRLIWSSGFEYSDLRAPLSIQAGQPFIARYSEAAVATFARTCDGKVLRIERVIFEGQTSIDPVRGSKHVGCFDGVQIADVTNMGGTTLFKNLLNGDLR